MRRLLLIVIYLLTNAAQAQVGPDGFDWVTIGAPGNRPYDGPDPFNLVAGRGSVDTEFRIARTELTTGQALEFFNAAFARPEAEAWFAEQLTSAPRPAVDRADIEDLRELGYGDVAELLARGAVAAGGSSIVAS